MPGRTSSSWTLWNVSVFYEIMNKLILNFLFIVVTYDRVLNFAKEFFQRLHTECFIFGNVTKQQATDIAGRVNTRLEATNALKLPILARQMLKKREYKLLAGATLV